LPGVVFVFEASQSLEISVLFNLHISVKSGWEEFCPRPIHDLPPAQLKIVVFYRMVRRSQPRPSLALTKKSAYQGLKSEPSNSDDLRGLKRAQ
jgi:hypothetical protein